MLKKVMIAFGAFLLTTPALAERPTRVLYMEVDQGQGFLEHENQAFERVFGQTGNFLQHRGLRLFEEDIDLDGRTYGDALDKAAAIKGRRMDAVVTVSLRHELEEDGRKSKDRLVAIAKIHDGRSLKKIDTVRVKSPVAVIRDARCEAECRDIIMRRHVREILPEFQEKLAEALVGYKAQKVKVSKKSGSEKYTLTLKGFKPREVIFIEDRIARLESTRDLSSLRSNPAKPAFWLERKKKAGNVRDDLSQVLANLDLQARIVQTETKITLIKVNPDIAYLD